jgi:hypothetical protein
MRTLTSADPLMAFWKFSSDPNGIELVLEFVAAANHRKALREELARATEFIRNIQNVMIANILQESQAIAVEFTPSVLAFVMVAVARAIVTESSTGVTAGHQEISAFIEKLLRQVTPQLATDPPIDSPAEPTKKRRSSKPKSVAAK